MYNPYELRKSSLIAELSAAGIEAALVTSPGSIFYLTGFHSDPHERFMGLLINPKESTYTLFVPALDQESASEAAMVSKLVAISDTDNAYELLGKEADISAAAIGIEKRHLNVATYEQLAGVFPKAAFRDVEPLLMRLRLRKSAEEIELVRAAVVIAEKVLQEAAAKAAVGVSELELNAEIEYRLRVLGGDKPAFETSVLGGARSALPHGRSGEYRLKENDFLLIDMGVYKGGYCSDITRTFVIGEGTAEQARIYDAVLAANRQGIAAAEAGRTLAAVDRAAREAITSRGYGEYFTHRVGHGFGIDIHELPSVHGSNESLIETGLLFTVEPGVYVPGVGGVRIEDDIYIVDDGKPQVLTSFPKELQHL
ncbi:M24 family metallopeptidase [Paenibacillus sp. Leaf72]|uniref:M24 family metallopeptidase n=1 Tax=Paenibacillus sp. Leaf72 TaxID=1736234 RepID=UPI0009D6937C|nr:Xaa-Pro peptidase family protein [Paenibacillus sp. Leaf72]